MKTLTLKEPIYTELVPNLDYIHFNDDSEIISVDYSSPSDIILIINIINVEAHETVKAYKDIKGINPCLLYVSDDTRDDLLGARDFLTELGKTYPKDKTIQSRIKRTRHFIKPYLP